MAFPTPPPWVGHHREDVSVTLSLNGRSRDVPMAYETSLGNGALEAQDVITAVSQGKFQYKPAEAGMCSMIASQAEPAAVIAARQTGWRRRRSPAAAVVWRSAAIAAENGAKGAKGDSHIQPERPVLDVVIVEARAVGY